MGLCLCLRGCLDMDGNGFWGDEYFDVGLWLWVFIMVVKVFNINFLVVVIGWCNEF